MKRRGFIFTLDAILTLLLVTMFVVSISQINPNAQVYSTYMRSQSNYVAEDTLTMFRTLSLRELVPPEKLEEWISDGTLNTTLVTPDMSPIDIVATYWATAPVFPEANLKHKAEVIMGYVLNNTLKDYNYELMINNYTSPYLRKTGANYSTASDVTPATFMLSGYAHNQTPRGYMARAFLTKAEYTRSDLFGWFRVLAAAESSDGESNTLVVTRKINIPAVDADSIYEADGNFIHRLYEKEDVYINDQKVTLSSSEPNAPNLERYLVPGNNEVKMVFWDYKAQDGYAGEIGIGSGTTLYVNYKSNSLNVDDPGLVKVYNITSSYTGFMYLLENFVPGNITSIDMKFTVEGAQVVRLYYGLGGNLYLLTEKRVDPNSIETVEFTNSEIESALDGLGITYEDLSKMVFDFVLAVDAKYNDDTQHFYYGGASSDSYPCSDCGGVRERVLYGYPDSYVKINYLSKVVTSRYSIPLSIYVDYDDPAYSGYTGYHCSVGTYKSMSISYTLPSKATPWYADLWVGYCFSDSTTQTLEENGEEFYSGPNGRYAMRIAYTKMFDWMMKEGDNTFTATLSVGVDDGGTSYRYQATRGILKYFIEGYAGYGEVFPKALQGYPNYQGYRLQYYYGPSSEPRTILIGDPPYKDISIDELDPTRYAVDDAILRLFEKLNFKDDWNPGEWKSEPFDGSSTNPIDVDLPESVRIDFVSMGNIPGLFEPITITLRVWREG